MDNKKIDMFNDFSTNIKKQDERIADIAIEMLRICRENNCTIIEVHKATSKLLAIIASETEV